MVHEKLLVKQNKHLCNKILLIIFGIIYFLNANNYLQTKFVEASNTTMGNNTNTSTITPSNTPSNNFLTNSHSVTHNSTGTHSVTHNITGTHSVTHNITGTHSVTKFVINNNTKTPHTTQSINNTYPLTKNQTKSNSLTKSISDILIETKTKIYGLEKTVTPKESEVAEINGKKMNSGTSYFFGLMKESPLMVLNFIVLVLPTVSVLLFLLMSIYKGRNIRFIEQEDIKLEKITNEPIEEYCEQEDNDESSSKTVKFAGEKTDDEKMQNNNVREPEEANNNVVYAGQKPIVSSKNTDAPVINQPQNYNENTNFKNDKPQYAGCKTN